MLRFCIILIHIVQLFSGTEYLYCEIWVLLDFSIHVGELLSLFKCLNKSLLILDILWQNWDWAVCLKFFYVLFKMHIHFFFFISRYNIKHIFWSICWVVYFILICNFWLFFLVNACVDWLAYLPRSLLLIVFHILSLPLGFNFWVLFPSFFKIFIGV